MQIIFVVYSICGVVFLPNHIHFIGSLEHGFHDVHECKNEKNRQIIDSLIDETQNEGQNVEILASTQLFR